MWMESSRTRWRTARVAPVHPAWTVIPNGRAFVVWGSVNDTVTIPLAGSGTTLTGTDRTAGWVSARTCTGLTSMRESRAGLGPRGRT